MLAYIDEDVPLPAVAGLRAAGHDVLTALQAGMANRGIPDEQQLEFAATSGRTLITMNRNDFSQLHRRGIAHHGIIVCTRKLDAVALGGSLVKALADFPDIAGALLRVNAGATVLDSSTRPEAP
jgi:hypothetical protein